MKGYSTPDSSWDMWALLNATFAFITAAVGLLGVGAVLDSSVPQSRKRHVAQWAKARVQQWQQRDIGGDRLFRRVFGERYISKRSIATSVFLSLGFITVFYFVAYITSPADVQVQIFPIRNGIDDLGWVTIFVYVPIILACDFISYAQTRLFLSYIDRVKNLSVSVVLYIGDMMFSVVLFVAGYAFARAIVTIIVVSSHYSAPFERQIAVSPDVVVATYRAFLGPLKLEDPLSRRIARLDAALMAYRDKQTLKTERAVIGEILALEYGDIAKSGGKLSSASLYCLRDLSFARENQNRVFEVLRDSDQLVMSKVGLSNFTVEFGGRAPFYGTLALSNDDNACPIYVVNTKVKIVPRAAIYNIAWIDYFLGSLSATINELNAVVYSKLSVYPSDDPVAQAPIVLGFALVSSKSHILGIGDSTDAISFSYYLHDIRTGSVQIPLGPLVASSLAANLIFGVYILLICSIAVGTRMFEFAWTSRMLKADAVFVRISAGVVVVVLVSAGVAVAIHACLEGLVQLTQLKPLGR